MFTASPYPFSHAALGHLSPIRSHLYISLSHAVQLATTNTGMEETTTGTLGAFLWVGVLSRLVNVLVGRGQTTKLLCKGWLVSDQRFSGYVLQESQCVQQQRLVSARSVNPHNKHPHKQPAQHKGFGSEGTEHEHHHHDHVAISHASSGAGARFMQWLQASLHGVHHVRACYDA